MTTKTITKVTLEEFIEKTDWGCKEKAFWKGIFYGVTEWDEWMFEERHREVWDALKHLRYVPYWKEGKLHLSEAMSLSKLIKRLRYVMRGNSIPSYGLEFKEIKSGWYTLTIDGKEFKWGEHCVGSKRTWIET